MLQVGMTYTVEQTVTTDMTARAIGSGGLEVFGPGRHEGARHGGGDAYL